MFLLDYRVQLMRFFRFSTPCRLMTFHWFWVRRAIELNNNFVSRLSITCCNPLIVPFMRRFFNINAMSVHSNRISGIIIPSGIMIFSKSPLFSIKCQTPNITKIDPNAIISVVQMATNTLFRMSRQSQCWKCSGLYDRIRGKYGRNLLKIQIPRKLAMACRYWKCFVFYLVFTNSNKKNIVHTLKVLF